MALCACSAPIVYPRSAEIARRTQARLAIPIPVATSKPASESGDDYRHPAFLAALPLSIQGELALPIAEVCEGRGEGSAVRLGLEVRCGPLQETRGAPLSIALSVAYLHHVDPLLFIPIDIDGDEGPDRDFVHWGALRGGIDLSARFGNVTPSLGVYAIFAFQDDDLTVSHNGADMLGLGTGTAMIRDRWRLALPLGASLGNLDQRVVWQVGLSPELTLAPEPRGPDSYGPLAHVKRRVSVLFTVGLRAQ